MEQSPLFPAYASVILDLSLDKTLDYGIPEPLLSSVQPGSQVAVPLKGVNRTGYILNIKSSSPCHGVKPILHALSATPLFSKELFELALWTSRYYCAPLSSVFQMILPPAVRKGMPHKEQWFVGRVKSREELKELCILYRIKKPAQAAILEVLLNVAKGMFLSELLEKSGAKRSSLDCLVKAGYLSCEKREIDRSPLVGEEYFITKPKLLNTEQAAALAAIKQTLDTGQFQTHLIHGITGSGKTEIYLQAIEKALELERGTILLVPEIALTQQTIERFKSRFKEKMSLLHSRLSQGERRDEWHNLQSGKAKIAIGARSAIFSPIQNLGLIIVDEEHEQSYKQQELAPCYQGRDVAVMRGKFAQAAVLLGSATPSLESYYNALTGKYALSSLQIRADSASLPQVTVVDMKHEFEKTKGFTSFSEKLLNGIETRCKRGEQIILFLNRRGYHTSLICRSCGKTIQCRECALPMTFHFSSNHLACHLCGYTLSPPPRLCPHCRSDEPLKFRGVGTEHIERSLKAIFPEIRSLRVDADTTKHKGSLQKLLREFGSGKAELLIGTQMIAKGLHFPEVTLVGILNADASLNIPDFRASETTFQLITQVAGRSGRGVHKGEVILQTFTPESSVIQHAAKQDYAGFYEEEIAVRKLFHYPPFVQMAKFLFKGKQEALVAKSAEKVRAELMGSLPSDFQFHPVASCGYVKIKGEFRYQFLVRAKSFLPLNLHMQQIKNSKLLPSSIKMHLDINPSSTFS